MGELSDRWKAAKADFERLTGQKKPAPGGFFASAFNHSGLTDALKDADKARDALNKAVKPEDYPKAIKVGDKALAGLKKATSAYVKVLDAKAKDEVADNAGEKTTVAKGLKFLKAELKSIQMNLDQYIDQKRVAAEGGSGFVQAAKLVRKGLEKSIDDAKVAYKKTKLDPTPATYNEFMRQANSPGRKIQVQLQTAARMLKAGELPELSVDPGFVAEKFAPYQNQHAEGSSVPDDATPQQVLAKMNAFKDLVKLAQRYSDELSAT